MEVRTWDEVSCKASSQLRSRRARSRRERRGSAMVEGRWLATTQRGMSPCTLGLRSSSSWGRVECCSSARGAA